MPGSAQSPVPTFAHRISAEKISKRKCNQNASSSPPVWRDLDESLSLAEPSHHFLILLSCGILGTNYIIRCVYKELIFSSFSFMRMRIPGQERTFILFQSPVLRGHHQSWVHFYISSVGKKEMVTVDTLALWHRVGMFYILSFDIRPCSQPSAKRRRKEEAFSYTLHTALLHVRSWNAFRPRTSFFIYLNDRNNKNSFYFPLTFVAARRAAFTFTLINFE